MRKTPANGESSRTRLLDAAERLFAEYGFDAPSVRDITSAAEVRLAAVSEMFGGLEGLTRAVVERRALPLAESRLQRLRAAGESEAATLEAIAAAFVDPLFERMEQDDDWRNYARVAAQLASSANWDSRLGHLLETEAPEFLDAIQAAEPRFDRAAAAWCYTFMMGALATSTSGTGWVTQLSQGMVAERKPETLRSALLAYAPAAMRSVADAIDEVRRDTSPIAKFKSVKARDLILDVAERLFAAHGFYGVSMRSIAAAADISVGLCHYYFKTKEGVFLAMCLRRHPELNEERWQVLEEARAMPPGRDRLGLVIYAHLGTAARRIERGGRGWRNHLRAMATAITSHGDYWLETLRVVSDDVAHAVVEEASESIPGLSLRASYIAHLFANGLMAVGYSASGRLERLSGGSAKGSDYPAMYRHLHRFHIGGVLAIAAV